MSKIGSKSNELNKPHVLMIEFSSPPPFHMKEIVIKSDMIL